MDAAISGLRAADTMFAVAADNIANMNTSGYRPRRAELTHVAGPPGGPGRGVAVTHVAAAADQQELPGGLSGVDLVTEIGASMVAATMYRANARVLELHGKMAGELVRLRA